MAPGFHHAVRRFQQCSPGGRGSGADRAGLQRHLEDAARHQQPGAHCHLDRCHPGGARGAAVCAQFQRRADRPAHRARHPPRAVCQPAGQEHDLPQPAAGGRHHGARHQRCPRGQLPLQPGRQPGDRLGAFHGDAARSWRRATTRPWSWLRCCS